MTINMTPVKNKGKNLIQKAKDMPDGLKLMLMALPFLIFVFIFAYISLYGSIYSFYDFIPRLGFYS